MKRFLPTQDRKGASATVFNSGIALGKVEMNVVKTEMYAMHVFLRKANW